MKVPKNFELISNSFTEDESKEFLRWVDENDSITVYPTFFKTELRQPVETVKHFVTDERWIGVGGDDKVTIEELLEKPYWIIDILPKQVPKESPEQYFAIEDFFLKDQLSEIKKNKCLKERK